MIIWDHERDEMFISDGSAPAWIVGVCEDCGAGIDENEDYGLSVGDDGSGGAEEVMICADCMDRFWNEDVICRQ